MIEGISQFERYLISQRTKEGLAATRARGKKGGRKPKLDLNKKNAMYELSQQKRTTLKDLCSMLSISKPTLYKVIEEISKNEM